MAVFYYGNIGNLYSNSFTNDSAKTPLDFSSNLAFENVPRKPDRTIGTVVKTE